MKLPTALLPVSATVILLAASALLATAKTEKPAPDKTGWIEPVVREIEGWTVHIDPQLLDGPVADEYGTDALKMLANHLQRIAVLVPEPRLAELRKLEIWIEHEHPKMRAMCYHPSETWLIDHGHDPRLAKKVHVTRARQLLSRDQMLKHPAVILHELAHSYHDQVLGFDHPEILANYQRTMEKGLYDKVLLYNGDHVKHYGTTDHKEYFAEATEAFFYRNDFYPFVRAELREHDPLTYDLMKQIWEQPE